MTGAVKTPYLKLMPPAKQNFFPHPPHWNLPPPEKDSTSNSASQYGQNIFIFSAPFVSRIPFGVDGKQYINYTPEAGNANEFRRKLIRFAPEL